MIISTIFAIGKICLDTKRLNMFPEILDFFSKYLKFYF